MHNMRLIGTRVVALLLMLSVIGGLAGSAAAQNETDVRYGEVPTTGAMRPGPTGLLPSALTVPGAIPVTISIPAASVDNAPVEQSEIIDGVMQNPTGPWVVSWYQETGRLGETDNVVLAGHLDYWDVGQAIFYYIGNLKSGDEITAVGDDGKTYVYVVEWVKNYTVDTLTSDQVQEIVGPTTTPAMTLITCGGPFDYAKGEYLERMIVRAHLKK